MLIYRIVVVIVIVVVSFRSKYTTPAGEERYAAATQFESVDARRSFPCWDEPAHKATFDVTLVVPQDKLALSNMVRILGSSLVSAVHSVRTRDC